MAFLIPARPEPRDRIRIAPLLDLAGLPIDYDKDENTPQDQHLADAESVSLSPGEWRPGGNAETESDSLASPGRGTTRADISLYLEFSLKSP